MRIRSVHTGSGFLITAVCYLIFSGAGCNHAQDHHHALLQIEAESGLSLSQGAQLLSSGDGGGRVPGYYQWLLFASASNQITMPSLQLSNYTEITNELPLILGIMEKRTRKEIANPLYALSCRWDRETNEYSATILITRDAEYFHLERFRR
jgi:hypothetical protein